MALIFRTVLKFEISLNFESVMIFETVLKIEPLLRFEAVPRFETLLRIKTGLKFDTGPCWIFVVLPRLSWTLLWILGIIFGFLKDSQQVGGYKPRIVPTLDSKLEVFHLDQGKLSNLKSGRNFVLGPKWK